jgi:glycerol-3-phosphate cytidylyltransferase-like family protein
LRGQLRTAAKGAETIVYLATSDEVAGITGRYFRDKKEIRSSDVSYIRQVRDVVWASSVRLSGTDL